jgi:preprotein translocase subunit SecA
LYDKLSGMTGTADTEAFEFQQIYGLEVVVIPTHKPMVREDHGDLVYLSKQEKFESIIADIEDCVQRGQPVLVGTASIDTSEYLSAELDKHQIKHRVLNAKFHEKEAQIIAQAGRPRSVTVATNMAGRGTDIVLGGNLDAELMELGEEADPAVVEMAKKEWHERHDEVLAAGGLHITGTERHESRRIDNQLRGRAGRQGDAGSSRFYLSLEDDLMRIFASDRVAAIMQKLGMEEGEAIEHPWVSKAIENAQRKVEGHNFDIRKNLLEFDNVANDQRKVVYEQRNDLMEVDDISENIMGITHDVVNDLIDGFILPGSMDEQWDVAGLETAIHGAFDHRVELQSWLDEDDSLYEEGLRDRIFDEVKNAYKEKEKLVGDEVMRLFEKQIMLSRLDSHWKEHLSAMDHLRQGIHLRGYAQKNPKQEYKREAFEMFARMLDEIKRDVVGIVTKAQVRSDEDMEALERQRREAQEIQYRHAEARSALSGDSEEAAEQAPSAAQAPFVRSQRKVGRNEPCPCGSGKKYKQCHGKLS